MAKKKELKTVSDSVQEYYKTFVSTIGPANAFHMQLALMAERNELIKEQNWLLKELVDKK